MTQRTGAKGELALGSCGSASVAIALALAGLRRRGLYGEGKILAAHRRAWKAEEVDS